MNADELPPFSGDNPTCPKCGNVGATATYLDGMPMLSMCTGPWEERLCRRCRRCGYHWDEAIAEPGDDVDGGLLDDRAVAKRCRDLYNRWTWSWMRDGRAKPDPQQLNHELYTALVGDWPTSEEEQR